MAAGPRFFSAVPLSTGAVVTLPEDVSRHMIRVLRMAVGDRVVVFDGRGGEYPGVIVRADRQCVSVEAAAWSPVERESPVPVRLAQGISSGDKMDLTLQKAVELGVAGIQPLATERSVVRLAGDRAEKRLRHWEGVVASACEQCGRNRLPPVAPPQSLNDWLGICPPADLKLLLSPRATLQLRDLSPPGGGAWLLAGPEGGLSPGEESAAVSRGFTPVRLGPRVLRTETAALAALAAIQTLWGDF